MVKVAGFESVLSKANVGLNFFRTSSEVFQNFKNTFKTRYLNHTSSFRHKTKRNATELSKHIWKLKDSNTSYTINWKIIKKSQTYSNKTKRCNLCMSEKFIIICHPELSSLNKRNELISTCRHRKKFLLR